MVNGPGFRINKLLPGWSTDRPEDFDEIVKGLPWYSWATFMGGARDSEGTYCFIVRVDVGYNEFLRRERPTGMYLMMDIVLDEIIPVRIDPDDELNNEFLEEILRSFKTTFLSGMEEGPYEIWKKFR